MLPTPDTFSKALVTWQKAHGRHDLPWQLDGDAYGTWLSEVMLQQTQVSTVIPYYLAFRQAFPSIRDLANASIEQVLAQWSGLGYYRRAHHLHAAAQQIRDQHGGDFPRDWEAILALPGIGRSTAAAISVFVFGQTQAILDGNVKRVLARQLAMEQTVNSTSGMNRLWQAAETLVPETDVQAYTQGLMDLGSLVCTRTKPRCSDCPVQSTCQAFLSGQPEAFPRRSKRRSKQQETLRWWALQSQSKLLFMERPTTGIWSGLWSLPSAEELASLGCQISKDLAPSAILQHELTHKSLTIEVFESAVGQALHLSGTPFAWKTPRQALNLGLPAPLRQWLNQNHLASKE